jgi:membrane-associated phospholipid phosphatase
VKTSPRNHISPPPPEHQHHTARNRIITGNTRRHALQPSTSAPHGELSASPIITRFSWQTLKVSLATAEFATVGMLGFYGLLGIFYSAAVPNGLTFAAVDCALIWVMCILAMSDTHSAARGTSAPRLLAPARRLLLFPTLLIVYMQAPLYVPFVNPHDYDAVLAAWDRAVFGVNPTEWMYQFRHPLLTELLQTCYILFFLIPLCLGIEFHRRKSDTVFRKYAALFMMSLYGSYLLYFCMPAIGPCFTLHDFARMSEELPGVLFTDTFRMIINNGSGAGTATPLLTAHRNCMPSGHTLAAVVNIVCAFRYRSRYRWLVTGICAGILLSTVYLRYHYAVDVLAGFVIAPLLMACILGLQRFLRTKGFSAE